MKSSLSLIIILGALAGSLLAVVNDCRDVNTVTEPWYWRYFWSGDFHEELCKKEWDHEGKKCSWKGVWNGEKFEKSCEPIISVSGGSWGMKER